MERILAARTASRTPAKPRIAFLGAGWIGYHRMDAVARASVAEIVAVADSEEASRLRASALSDGCMCCTSLEELLERRPDGIVIATPNALHAAQTVKALESGAAVFCQKPLGIDASQTASAIATAAACDRLLSVDYSYRFSSGLRAVREIVRSGELESIFSADLAFHNAYGPDKPWYYDSAMAGGGCLTDLGIHLVDMALWCLGSPAVESVRARLYREGQPWSPADGGGEDFASVTLILENAAEVRIGCSWGAHAGADATISARFWGPDGAVLWENVGGSFYDFRSFRFTGTRAQALQTAPDDWGGGAILDWVRQLCEGGRYDAAIEDSLSVVSILDRAYGRR